MATLGERLKLLRSKYNLSQKMLAQNINIAQNTLSMYESDQRSPNDTIKKRIADFFGVSLDYLMGTSDVMNPSISPKNLVQLKEIIYEHLDDICFVVSQDLGDTQTINGLPSIREVLTTLNNSDKVLLLSSIIDDISIEGDTMEISYRLYPLPQNSITQKELSLDELYILSKYEKLDSYKRKKVEGFIDALLSI